MKVTVNVAKEIETNIREIEGLIAETLLKEQPQASEIIAESEEL